MISLRPYQEDIIEKARESFRTGHKSPLIVSPCGSGKTVCFAYFASRVTLNYKRTLILAHRDELLDQISATLSEFKVKHGFVAPGRMKNYDLPVQVASVFSVIRRLNLIHPPDVIVIDEAHHSVTGSSWSKVFEAFPKALKIGVTATPQRLSGEGLDDVFDDLILGPSVRELIDLGSLCDYKIYAPSTIDTSGLHQRMGDFNKTELAKASDKPSITGDAIKEYERHANGKKAIVFCVSIEHAKHVAGQFQASGHKALSVDGKLDKEIRRGIVKDFRGGKINVLTSCDIISEGFDLPSIEAAIMLRPTASLGLWIQQSGRALRTSPGKEKAIILDHSGNCLRHGLPDEPRTWSLAGKVKKKTDKPTVSVRACPRCFAVMHFGAFQCKYCGHVFAVTPREIEHKQGDLTEIDVARFRKDRKIAQGRAKTKPELIAFAIARKYKNPSGWANMILGFRAKKGVGV